MAMQARLAPLRLPEFRRLLLAYFVGRTGDWLGEVALSVVVLRSTGSVLAVTLLWVAVSVIPAPFGPLLVSKLCRRGVIAPLVVARLSPGGLLAAMSLAAALGAP